jgi:hypothetical protein
MEFILLLAFAALIFFLTRKILIKAGFDPNWAFCLIIPVVNIIMIWVFAFAKWPKLKKSSQADI